MALLEDSSHDKEETLCRNTKSERTGDVRLTYQSANGTSCCRGDLCPPPPQFHLQTLNPGLQHGSLPAPSSFLGC